MKRGLKYAVTIPLALSSGLLLYSCSRTQNNIEHRQGDIHHAVEDLLTADIWSRDDGEIPHGERIVVTVRDLDIEERQRQVSIEFSPDGHILYLDGQAYGLYGATSVAGLRISVPAAVFSLEKRGNVLIMEAGGSLRIFGQTIRIGGDAAWDPDTLRYICEVFAVEGRDEAQMTLNTSDGPQTFRVIRGGRGEEGWIEVEVVE